MKVKLTPITRHWTVSGTIPSQSQKYHNYGENVNIGIEADSIQAALEAAKAVYPDITIFNCHHRGEVHVRSANMERLLRIEQAAKAIAPADVDLSTMTNDYKALYVAVHAK